MGDDDIISIMKWTIGEYTCKVVYKTSGACIASIGRDTPEKEAVYDEPAGALEILLDWLAMYHLEDQQREASERDEYWSRRGETFRTAFTAAWDELADTYPDDSQHTDDQED